MILRRAAKSAFRRVKRWLEEPEADATPQPAAPEPEPFDNSYRWLQTTFARFMGNPVCASRPQYVWGLLQGAALAKVLGHKRVSVLEFGVASGAGLVALERTAEECEALIGLGIDVAGFDTGTGFPKPQDYRDMPYRWFEGYYPCDKDELRKRLHRAVVHYGLVGETVQRYIASKPAPVAFVATDLCLYSSTSEALQIFAADHALLLPRTPCSFRSAVGKDNCGYTGELAAVAEFNSNHSMRKICQINALQYFVPPQFNGHWTQMIYTTHLFDHPQYGHPQSYQHSAVIDIEGREIFVEARPGVNLASGEGRSVKAASQ